MDILDGAGTFAGSDERVVVLSRIQTYPADLLTVRYFRMSLPDIIFNH